MFTDPTKKLKLQPFTWAQGLWTWNTFGEDHWPQGGHSDLCPLWSWNKPSLRCFTQLQSMQSRQGNRKTRTKTLRVLDKRDEINTDTPHSGKLAFSIELLNNCSSVKKMDLEQWKGSTKNKKSPHDLAIGFLMVSLKYVILYNHISSNYIIWFVLAKFYHIIPNCTIPNHVISNHIKPSSLHIMS